MGRARVVNDLLLCVGAQKSGTTWLYNRLAAHPEMRRATHKELHYFSTVHCGGRLGPTIKMNAMKRMIARHPQQVAKFIQSQATGEKPPREVMRVFRPFNDSWYVNVFAGTGRYAMDFTPEYAKLPDEGHDHIKRLSKQQKIIFIMREPVDRALSAIRYVFRNSGRDIQTATEAEVLEVARKPVIVKLSEYENTIDTLERNYSPDDIRILFYESMMAEKANTLNALCEWLDIEPSNLPPDELEQRDNSTDAFNPSAAIVEELRDKLLPVRAAIEARFPEARAAWADVTATLGS